MDDGVKDIAREMSSRAVLLWGPERAETLRGLIEDVAGSIQLLYQRRLELDGDEPEPLPMVAPAPEVG